MQPTIWRVKCNCFVWVNAAFDCNLMWFILNCAQFRWLQKNLSLFTCAQLCLPNELLCSDFAVGAGSTITTQNQWTATICGFESILSTGGGVFFVVSLKGVHEASLFE